MTPPPESLLAVVLIAAGVLVGWSRPCWLLPAAFLIVPLRVPIVSFAEISTLFLLGGALARAPALPGVLRRHPIVVAALFVFPLWLAVSALWATQGWFALREAGKWLVLTVAALVALADDAKTPRPVVIAAALAMAFAASWGIAERLHLLAPLGDRELLRDRLIDFEGTIRGRALFYHPNRLSEFVEQIGLLLAACAVLGPMRIACALGALLAFAGTWSTGSTAGMATMFGGGLLVAALLIVWRARMSGVPVAPQAAVGSSQLRSRVRLALLLSLPVAAGAAALVASRHLFEAHGGLGPRAGVYRYAWGLIQGSPWLGIGGGNWPLEVGRAPFHLSRFWFRTHTHSLPLQIWVEAGAIGLLASAAMFAVPVATVLRGIRACDPAWRGVAIGAAAGVLGLLAHNVVHYFLRQPADGIPTGLLLGWAVAAVSRRARGDG